jgi:pterin-4a-carbinolamine dehydratase
MDNLREEENSRRRTGRKLSADDTARSPAAQAPAGGRQRDLDRAPGWEAWEDGTPREYRHVRPELRKHYLFDGFLDAASFMREASVMFERRQHHP